MNSHQFGNTTTRRTKSLALIRCIDHQRKLRKYLFMAGIKRRSFDRKPICETFSRECLARMNLGVVLDPCLSWNDHINFITNKISSRLGMLRKAEKILPQETYITLYNAMILPLITAPQYGIAVAKQTATS